MAGLCAGAYLLGVIPFTFLVGKIAGGIDLRRRGSGNVGASNLARELGIGWFVPISIWDLLRGSSAVAAGHYLLPDGYAWALAVIPLFTLAGNAWSPLLRFNGGRSVAVWAGAVLAASPTLFLAALLVYLAGWRITRRSAEWLLVVMAVLPAVAGLWPAQWILIGSPGQAVALAAAGATLILVKRLTANGETPPAGVSRAAVLANRLLRDRDIAGHSEWLKRGRP